MYLTESPRLAGPLRADSATWRVTRENVLQIASIRAILLEAAHAGLIEGFLNHTGFDEMSARQQIQRLHRTAEAHWAAMFEPVRAETIWGHVRELHRKVSGVTTVDSGPFPAGTPYEGSAPESLLWIWATVVDSWQLAYRTYVRDLSAADLEDFYQGVKRTAYLADTPDDVIPPTYGDFREYWEAMLASDTITVTPAARGFADMLLGLPENWARQLLPGWARVTGTLGRAALTFHTAALLPADIRRDYGLRWSPAHQAAFVVGQHTVKRAVLPLVPDRFRVAPPALSAELEFAAGAHR